MNKLFITHMHGDHCLGLVPLLLTMGETVVPNQAPVESQALDIYGPSGVRELVRLCCYSGHLLAVPKTLN